MVAEREGGIYVLVLRLCRPASISVGRLGNCEFPAGWYAYVGSAHGTGGLQARIMHHLRPPVRYHWHLDYLRTRAYPVEVWYRPGGSREDECIWAEAMTALPNVSIPVAGFGASDCHCQAHLFHCTEPPDVARLAQILRTSISSQAVWMKRSDC